jgi:hypothetical protein
MLAPASNRKLDTALMIPGPSGQEISRRSIAQALVAVAIRCGSITHGDPEGRITAAASSAVALARSLRPMDPNYSNIVGAR